MMRDPDLTEAKREYEGLRETGILAVVPETSGNAAWDTICQFANNTAKIFNILDILETHREQCYLRLYVGFNQYIASLEVGGIHYRGEGNGPRDAISALVTNIAEVSPNLLPKEKQR